MLFIQKHLKEEALTKASLFDTMKSTDVFDHERIQPRGTPAASGYRLPGF
jgi:hypothetical protein